MRVTAGMIQQSSMNALNNNMVQLNKLYDQMNTLKKIQRPSDNPLIATKSMKIKMELVQINQYKNNISEATSQMDTAEAALSNISEILKEVRTLCSQAANDTLTQEDRQIIVDNVVELMGQIKQEANAQYGGKYLFTGYKTNEPMYINDPDNPKEKILNPAIIDSLSGESFIENQGIEYEITAGTYMQVNTLGMDTLLLDIENDIQAMIDAMSGSEEEQSAFFSDMMSQIDQRLDSVSSKISDIGSKQKRLEYTLASVEKSSTNKSELLNETEGVDIEQIYIEFNTQYMVYQSALQASSKLLQNTLADYLR